MPTPVKPNEVDGRVEVARRPRAWLPWVVAALAVLLLFEGGARLVEATDPPIVDWYDAATHQRVAMMDNRSADGVETAVVFAGTSMPWQDFVPEVFTTTDEASRTAFNTGLAGADTVVWGLSSLDFAPNYGATQLDAYETAKQTRTGVLATADRMFSRFSALIRMRNLMRRPSELVGAGADDTRADIAEAARITGTDGERLDFDEDLGSQREAIMKARLKGYDVADPDDIAALRDAVTELRARGVDVIFVAMPVPPRFVDLHPEGGGIELTTSTIAALGGELGVDVVDVHDRYIDDDFVDYTHLDQPAAADLTAAVARALDQRDSITVGSCSVFGDVRVCRNR